MLGQTIYHGMSSNVKHISMIACVPTAGESLVLYAVTLHHSSFLQEPSGTFRRHGVRLGTDFILRSNRKPDVNTEIFPDHMRTVFDRILLNFVISRHLQKKLPSFGWILVPHITDDLIRLLTEIRVSVIAFPLHKTQIVQILDLTLFAVLRRRSRYELSFRDDRATVKCTMKVYHD
jgi:hypothetical protein